MKKSYSLRLFLSILLPVFLSSVALAENQLVRQFESRDEKNNKIFFNVYSSSSETAFSVEDSDPKNGILIKYANGNILSLKLRKRPLLNITVPLQIETSTCTRKINSPKCYLNYSAREDELRLVWQNHKNLEKINQDFLDEFGELLIEEDYLWDFSYQNSYPQNTGSLNHTQFHCEDYTWLTDDNHSPKEITLREWANEIMFPNFETRISENKAFLGYHNMKFTQNSSGKFDLISFDHPVSLAGEDTISPLLGDIMGWTIEKGDDLCEVAFKPDAESVTRAANYLEDPSVPLAPFLQTEHPEIAKRFFNNSELVNFLLLHNNRDYSPFAPDEVKNWLTYGFLKRDFTDYTGSDIVFNFIAIDESSESEDSE